MDTNKQASVLDFQAFKAKKAIQGERKSGLEQSFKVPTVNNSSSDLLSTEGNRSKDDIDLSARIERIKSSINRINQLMAELKSMSPSADKKR